MEPTLLLPITKPVHHVVHETPTVNNLLVILDLTRALAQQMIEKQLRIPSTTSVTGISAEDVKLTGKITLL